MYQGEGTENTNKTTLVSRNITVMGRRTSVRLELEMWNALKEIADREYCTIHDICTLVKMRKNPATSLTAAIRVFLMLYFRASSTEEGHHKAGHGSFKHMVSRARIPEEETSYFSSLQDGKMRQSGSALANAGGVQYKDNSYVQGRA